MTPYSFAICVKDDWAEVVDSDGSQDIVTRRRLAEVKTLVQHWISLLPRP